MKTLKPEEVFEYLYLKWNWIAMDENKKWFAYNIQPVALNNDDMWHHETGKNHRLQINIDYSGNWRDSLFSRQALPDEKDLKIAELENTIARLIDKLNVIRIANISSFVRCRKCDGSGCSDCKVLL